MLSFRVPATTTNLGHGFDCLGMALAAANVITVEPHRGSSPGDGGLQAMAERVRGVCARAWSCALPPIAVTVVGDVPIARGLGSSATIVVGVAAACRALAGLDSDHDASLDLLAIAAEIEGHPDNAAAAVFGGFTVVGRVDGRLRLARFAVPDDLVAVVAIPPFEVKTSEARRILPATLERADAVQALQLTALVTAALAGGQLDDLRGLFDDAWHERHRARLNPGLAEARAAARSAGALGTILSGSGSAVLSFARRAGADTVRDRVRESYACRGVAAEVRVIAFDDRGVSPA